jgi:hypothetical protein
MRRTTHLACTADSELFITILVTLQLTLHTDVLFASQMAAALRKHDTVDVLRLEETRSNDVSL